MTKRPLLVSGTFMASALIVLAVLLVVANRTGAVRAQDDAPCANGMVIADPDRNPLLVSDCPTLLDARLTLDPTDQLNWEPTSLLR